MTKPQDSTSCTTEISSTENEDLADRRHPSAYRSSDFDFAVVFCVLSQGMNFVFHNFGSYMATLYYTGQGKRVCLSYRKRLFSIEGFYVTSYQVILKVIIPATAMLVSSSDRTGLEKTTTNCSITLNLIYTLLPNYNRVKRI